MTVYLSPVNGPFVDANGNPLSGGKINTYQAGTSTPLATFTSNDGITQQANPIILNTLGLPASPIWLNASTNYKFVVTNSADAAHQTIDNISGINDVSAASSEWNESGFVPTYISAVSFSVPGDQTALLQINRRIRTRNTSGYVYSRISASVYGSVTTVTVVNDSTTLDAGLSLVAYSFLSPSPNSVPYGAYVVGDAIGAASGTALGSKIQSISASVAASALTISASQVSLDFRSATLSSGTVTTVTGTPANLVISSGSTLGTVNGVQSRIAVLALNNAGTIELAAVNVAGGNDLSETGLISTTAEGGAGAADSATVVYSTTTRSSVAYRVIGYIESTQATAGTWATAPSTIQGAGGNALRRVNAICKGVAVATTSGVAVDFTSIPSWVQRITVMFAGVSTNGTSQLTIQLGDSGGIETTGYNGIASFVAGGSAGSQVLSSGVGFRLFNSITAASTRHGSAIFTLLGSNTWTCQLAISEEVSLQCITSGSKTLSATLDRIRITTEGGTDTFDAGSINILYE